MFCLGESSGVGWGLRQQQWRWGRRHRHNFIRALRLKERSLIPPPQKVAIWGRFQFIPTIFPVKPSGTVSCVESIIRTDTQTKILGYRWGSRQLTLISPCLEVGRESASSHHHLQRGLRRIKTYDLFWTNAESHQVVAESICLKRVLTERRVCCGTKQATCIVTLIVQVTLFISQTQHAQGVGKRTERMPVRTRANHFHLPLFLLSHCDGWCGHWRVCRNAEVNLLWFKLWLSDLGTCSEMPEEDGVGEHVSQEHTCWHQHQVPVEGNSYNDKTPPWPQSLSI